MATIGDISQELGDYMLRGWVLTDRSCSTMGCSVPLLRSPKGRTPITTFCVKCSGDKLQENIIPAISSTSDASSESLDSRSSTPATEFSAVPESPLFVPLPDTETRRRREQSDRASSEIGQKLLQGWAMLGEECPNDSCYGVPLVRPPKSLGEKDPRKACVICGNTYTTEVNKAGRESIVPFESNRQINRPSPLHVQINPSHSQASPVPSTAQSRPPFSSPVGSHLKEKEPASHLGSHLPQSSAQEVLHVPALRLTGSVLDDTSRALQTSLQALSGRLAFISSNLNTLDPVPIGATADAISKVAQALAQIQQLQSSQNHRVP